MAQRDGGTPAPRHGRHAASGYGGTRAPRRGSGSSGGSHFAGATTHRYQGYSTHESYDSDGMAEQAAPRPVLDPAATGSFRRIDASMGAKVENRQNVESLSADSTASWRRSGYGSEKRLSGAYRPQGYPTQSEREPKRRVGRKLVVTLVVLAALVVCGAGLLARNVLTHPADQGSSPKEVEKTVVDADRSITYRGVTYSLAKQSDGSYALVGASKGADPSVLASLSGTPASLVLYDGTIVVPENLDGSWDVVAYTIGTGTPVSQVVGSDGSAVGGSGSVDSVDLDDSDLVITDDSGKDTTVRLSGAVSAQAQSAVRDDSSSDGSASGK